MIDDILEAINEANETFEKYYRKKGTRFLVIPSLIRVANKVVGKIGGVLSQLKHEEITIETEHQIDENLSLLHVFDGKTKMYFFAFRFKDEMLSERLYGIVVKFVDQLSKPVVPSQVERFVNAIRHSVEKFLMWRYRGAWRKIKADISVFIITYNHTLGCFDEVRKINEAEKDKRVRLFVQLVRFNRAQEIIDRIVDFLKYRAGSLALHFFNKYKDEMKEWGSWVPEKAKKSLTSLLKVTYAIGSIVGIKKDNREIETIAIRMLREGISNPELALT